jgi:hypothetical protein
MVSRRWGFRKQATELSALHCDSRQSALYFGQTIWWWRGAFRAKRNVAITLWCLDAHADRFLARR